MVLLSGKLGLLLLQTLTFVIFKTYVKLLNFEFLILENAWGGRKRFSYGDVRFGTLTTFEVLSNYK